MVSTQGMQAGSAINRDQAIMDEFRRTRDLAIDAVASRAINLRIDLAACMAENEALRAKVATLQSENAALNEKVAILQIEADPPRKRGRGTRG